MTDLPDSLLNLAQRFAAPEHLLQETRRARYLGQPPSAGQIWSTSWDECSAMVLLLGSPDDRQSAVTAVPLTTEPGYEDETVVVLSPAATGWPVDLTAWLGMPTELPVRVLFESIDEVGLDLIDQLRKGSDPLPAGVRAGHASTGPFDPSERYRAEMIDTMSTLSSAPGLPTGDASDGDLRDLGLTLPDIRAALGTSQAEAMNILVGKKLLAPLEVERLVETKPNLTVDVVLSKVRPLPLALAQEIDQPTWKARILAAARRSQRDEFDTRRHIAYDTFATAARQDVSDDWAGRLRRYFEAHGGDGQ